jgi:hypothetical protein
MKGFYATLSSASKTGESYLKILDALTKIDLHQMATLASVPGWQDWSVSNSELAEA